ncbi:MAG: Ldh family oxidoreductase [Opitutaceae bacterium]|nr:Ldh family oxidoreductase [Opitutaceae bacterium]
MSDAAATAVFRDATLREFADRVLAAVGASPRHARIVARSLVEADLLGHESHGIMRLPGYVARVRAGDVAPAAEPAVARESGATAVVRGGWTFGQVTAHVGVEVAARLAASHGTGTVALHEARHVGRLGEYAEALAAHGLAAILFASGADRGGAVAPFGGARRVFGTNPLAWALPVPEGAAPLVGDFACSAIPAGKVHAARARGEPLPAGALLDTAGAPTTDPQHWARGGALLPFGAHKGSSLLFLIEMLASTLGGAAPSSSREFSPANPTLIIAIDIARFVPRETWLRQVEELRANVRACPPAAGFDRVRAPHELETETASRRRRDGVPLPATVVGELRALAASLSVAPP